jgi:hypothetical protein
MIMAIYSKFKVDKRTKTAVQSLVKIYGKGVLRVGSAEWAKAGEDLFPFISASLGVKTAKAVTMLELESIRHLYNARWHNIFLSGQELIDFIDQIKIPEESENLALMADDFGIKYPDGVVVHFLGGQESWLFYTNHAMGKGAEKHLGVKFPYMMVCHKRFLKRDGGHYSYFFMDRKNGRTTRDITKSGEQLQFFIKLLIYIDAFPESVTDGVPKDCSDTHIRRDMASVVSTAKQIKSMATNGICPHLRRGHFRFLQSDKFTNKRFQIVYVKPAIIGGTAETVKHQSVVC